jgi:hypothetical protein
MILTTLHGTMAHAKYDAMTVCEMAAHHVQKILGQNWRQSFFCFNKWSVFMLATAYIILVFPF